MKFCCPADHQSQGDQPNVHTKDPQLLGVAFWVEMWNSPRYYRLFLFFFSELRSHFYPLDQPYIIVQERLDGILLEGRLVKGEPKVLRKLENEYYDLINIDNILIGINV